jgi:hypothetical protein
MDFTPYFLHVLVSRCHWSDLCPAAFHEAFLQFSRWLLSSHVTLHVDLHMICMVTFRGAALNVAPCCCCYGPTALCGPSTAFIVSWSYIQSIGLLWRGISPSQGTIVWEAWDSSWLGPRVHCGRLLAVIPPCICIRKLFNNAVSV